MNKKEEIDVNKVLSENGYEGTYYFSNNEYSTALIGISTDGRAIYDYELMVKWLCDNDNIFEEEVMEWIDYNTIRSFSYLGNKSPIILCKLYDLEDYSL